MIVTITGANDYARKAELDKLVATFVAEHSDMAVERFDGEETSAGRMRESIQSLPFLSARKLVILREPSKQKVFAEHIAEALAETADTTDLIIYEPKLDKRLAYYKTLKKQTDFREFVELDGNGLAKWAVAYATQQGGSLSPTDARLLLDRIGPSQQLLRSELDKLLAYDPAITKQSIESLTEPMPQSTMFELLDAAFAGKTQRAFQLYHEQRALRVEPQAIIAMLAWQVQVVALVSAAGNAPADQIAKQAKLNPFVVRKTQGIARRLNHQQVKRLVADLLQLDVRLKTTAIDADEAVQLYLLQLAAK